VETAATALELLKSALAECGVRADRIEATAAQLTQPPPSFQISGWDPEGTETEIKARIPFNGDTAAMMLRPNDADATWHTLTRAERKRVRRLWASAMSPDSFSASFRGRPSEIDSALIVYCCRLIRETSGQSRFRVTRTGGEATPGGPMWRALVAALPLAFSFLADFVGAPTPRIRGRSETILEIAKVARSQHFENWCRKLGLGRQADDVAGAPASFRLAVSLARRRPQKAS
jgi:hypothetical protein